MSQQELAAALGVSRATIQAAETGANHRPGRALLDALERAGYDVVDIQQQFSGWKQEEQKRAQARLSAALRKAGEPA